MGEAGFIHRLFPAAKFILVLRHPCDCVLSCFMQQFALNDAMANFATIEESANLYNEVMSLWQVYCDKLPLEVHTVKYEDVIADTRGTIEPLLSYLGVPWSDNILDYRKTAASRENINTPSYSQVTEKLYSTAAGRWTRYADQMEDVLPVLAPWIEKFGYA